MPGDKLAADRVDLIKRLFAVTISVGFATQLSRIIFDVRYVVGPELRIGSIAADHWRDGLLLLIALVAVVASWEGYLQAVNNIPLEDRARFYIDITIVFGYLILMLSSQIFHLWFHLLVAIFLLYMVWDLCRMIAARRDVQQRAAPRPLFKASIAITLVWLCFFAVLDRMNDTSGTWSFAGAATSAFLGIVFYRIDKWRRFDWLTKFALVIVCLLPATLPQL